MTRVELLILACTLAGIVSLFAWVLAGGELPDVPEVRP